MKKSLPVSLWKLLTAVYCGLMLYLLFARTPLQIEGFSYQQMLRLNLNLQPFFTIRNYLTVIFFGPGHSQFWHCLTNLIGNFVLFIPAGIILPGVFPKLRRFFFFFPVCFLIIGIVETVQLFTLLGIFDVDDFILNIAGMVAGYLLCLPFSQKHR